MRRWWKENVVGSKNDPDYGSAFSGQHSATKPPDLLSTLDTVDVPDLPDGSSTPPELIADLATDTGTNFVVGVLRDILKRIIEIPDEKGTR